MQFRYTITNNCTPVELICKCDYDYSTDRGAEACLVSARMSPAKDCPNVVTLLRKEDKEMIEEYYLENLYALVKKYDL
jgi:hypothetical protein